MCRRSTMVCVSGGLLAFGSSLYPSYSFSKFDPPWKKHIPPDHADAGGEGSTKKVDGSARGVDTGTGVDNRTFSRGGNGERFCSPGSGTGCPYFVSTAEVGALAGVSVVSDDGCGDGDIGADGSDDDDTDERNYVICRDYMMGDISELTNEHTVITEHLCPRIQRGLHSEDILVGTSVRGNTCDDCAVAESNGDERNADDGGLSALQGEPAASRAYLWPWSSVNMNDENDVIKRRQGTTEAGRHGYGSTPVPNSVCFMVYIAAMLVAVSRGDLRRGIRMFRRVQRLARWSRYASWRVDERMELHGLTVATMPFFVTRFPFFRLISPGIHSHRLIDVELLSESRLEKHDKGDTYFVPLATSTTTSGSGEQETDLLGTWEEVEMIVPNVKSAVDRVESAEKETTTADLHFLPNSTRDRGKKEAEPTVSNKKLAGKTSKPSVKSSVDGMVTPSTKKPNMAFEAGQLSRDMQGKSTIDVEVDSSSTSTMKPDVSGACDLSTAPSTIGKASAIRKTSTISKASTTSKAISGVAGSSDTSTKATRKKNQQNAVTFTTYDSIPAASVSVGSLQRDVNVGQGPGHKIVTSSIHVEIGGSTRLTLDTSLDTASTTAAETLSTAQTARIAEPLGTKEEATKGSMRHAASIATLTATAACATKDRDVDTNVICAAALMKINKQAGPREMPGPSAGAIEMLKSQTTTSSTASTSTATTATGAATDNKDSSPSELNSSSKSAEAFQAKRRHNAAKAATSTTLACPAMEARTDTVAINESASAITSEGKTVGMVKPFLKISEEVKEGENDTAATSTVPAGTHALPDAARVTSKSTLHEFPRQGDRALQASRQKVETKPLSNVDGLFESRKPAIEAVKGWFSGISINIDQDGNCFGTAWMVAALVWAAQRPTRLQYLISELEDAGRPGQAFGSLDDTCKGYVDDFVGYVKDLKDQWIGHAEYDSTCATNLAVGVVKMFLGPNCESYVCDDTKDEDPRWLKLKWGVGIAARALDSWAAAIHDSELDTANLRRLRESVVLDFEKLQDTSTCSPDEGAAIGARPATDVLRPGGSMGLLTGLVVDTYARQQRITDDYTGLFKRATNTRSNRTTNGFAVLRAGLPHFDVLVTPSADVLFFATLAAVFELSEPEKDDPKSLAILKGNVESQRKTTTEELGKFVTSVTEYEQQIAAMQAFEGMKAARELEAQQAAQLKEEQQARDGDEQKASGVDVKTARGTEANTVRHGQPKHQHDQQSGNSRNSKKRGKRARQRNKR